MAVETAKIVIEGDTNGATVALKETARATDQVTTASKAAGAELADLTRQTQATSKAQAEATAAINRMRQAQDEAAMTARAFGDGSKEAAEAQARLARATDTAKKAEQAAKQELDQLKLGLAATSAAADKVSPALARATKETEKLSAAAERNANELKKSELQQTANARAASKGAGGFDLLGSAGGKLAAVLGPAALGGTLMAAGRWLGEAAERTLQYETSLKNLPFALDAAKDATHGLVSEQALAVSASQAVALGVVKSQAEFSQLASDASKIALKLGVSSEQMLGDLTTALGRGSAMILDNAGIVLKVSDANEAYATSIGKTVSELDESEKKLAFQTAAMHAIRESADATSVAYDGSAAAISRFKTTWENTTAAIERSAANAAGAVLVTAESAIDSLVEYGENAKAAAEITAQWNEEAGDGPITMGEWALATVRTSEAYAGLQTILASDVWATAGEQSRARADELSREADFAARQQKAYAKMLADQEAHLDAQAAASVTYGPTLPPKAEKRGGPRRKDEAFIGPGDVAIARIGDGRDETDAIASDAAFIERSNAATAEAAAIEQNIETRERSIEAIATEMEAREAAGLAQDDLIAKRFDRERELLDYTRRTSNDKARIAEAETRFAKVQHDRRLRDLRATYAAEQKEQAKRQATMQVVAGAVQGFGNAVVGAMEAEAEGSKGAIAKSLQAWLVGVRNQMLVKGAVELALVAASAASFNPVGVTMHATAAGLAFAAAGAAGIAGAAIGAAVPGDSGSAGAAGAAGGGSGGGAGRSGGGGGGGRDGNERQDVPLSFADTRSKTTDMPRTTSSSTTNHATVTHVHVTGLVAGDENRLGAEISRLAEKGKRLGRRN